MRKLKEHVNRWKKWKKTTGAGLLYKLLVLFGLRKDIGFEWTFTDKETNDILKEAYSIKKNYPEERFE